MTDTITVEDAIRAAAKDVSDGEVSLGDALRAHFPTATTGDDDPGMAFALQEAIEGYIAGWALWNVQDGDPSVDVSWERPAAITPSPADRIIVEVGVDRVIDVHDIPCGLRVEVREYDTQSNENDDRHMERDAVGHDMFVSVYEPAIDCVPAALVTLRAAAAAALGYVTNNHAERGLRDAIEEVDRLTV